MNAVVPIRHRFTITARRTDNGRRINNKAANIHGSNTNTTNSSSTSVSMGSATYTIPYRAYVTTMSDRKRNTLCNMVVNTNPV